MVRGQCPPYEIFKVVLSKKKCPINGQESHKLDSRRDNLKNFALNHPLRGIEQGFFQVWFDEVAAGTELSGNFAMPVATTGGEHGDWYLAEGGIFLDAGEEFQSIHAGHLDIAEDDIAG